MPRKPKPQKSQLPRERFSRPPLARMYAIHQQLLAGDFPNCRKLGEAMEVSGKTIQRDIEFMRDRYMLPIEYDPQHCGYYYTEPVTHFPNMEVSQGEIVALAVAQKALAQYHGTSFEKPLRAAFKKITDALQDKVSFQWGEVESGISFRGIGSTEADLVLFETVSSAVIRSRELIFEYQKLRSKNYERRKVQPYHIGCIDQCWYLFAHDLERQQMRTFSLTRMRNVDENGARFRKPNNFSIEAYLRDSLGVFTGKGRYEVKIHFDAFAARLIAERHWHPSQKLRALKNDELEMTLELASLAEIERWILSWGAHARVIAPGELRDAIHSTARAILERGN